MKVKRIYTIKGKDREELEHKIKVLKEADSILALYDTHSECLDIVRKLQERLDEYTEVNGEIIDGYIYEAIPIVVTPEIEQIKKNVENKVSGAYKNIDKDPSPCALCYFNKIPCYKAAHIAGCYLYSDNEVVYKKPYKIN